MKVLKVIREIAFWIGFVLIVTTVIREWYFLQDIKISTAQIQVVTSYWLEREEAKITKEADSALERLRR